MKKSLASLNWKIFLIIPVLIQLCCLMKAQDLYPAKQLTFDPVQAGFPTWSPNGKYIIYSLISFNDTLNETGLWRITHDGKKKKQILSVLAEHPRWSPDGRFIVFDSDAGKNIKMIRAKGGSPVEILPDTIKIIRGGMPCWSPDGSKIAFLEGGTLSLCVLSPRTGEVKRIFREEGFVPIPGCWTPDGKRIMFTLMNMQSRKSTLWKISSDGKLKEQITGHHEGLFRHLAISPDGSLLVYAVFEGRFLSLWIMPANGGKSVPLSVTPSAHNEGPQWSPDGKKIAFTTSISKKGGVWLMNVDLEKLKKELIVNN